MRFWLTMLLLSCAAPVAAQSDWPLDLIDPAHADDPADLILPMPCGVAMAFQKVSVPVDTDDPLADRRVRLGQSLDQTGYSDYLLPAYLRGPFSDAESGTDTGSTHYYIARYELTRGQYRALTGDCAPPTRADRVAQGGLSWFDAVGLARDYSQWLFRNAPDRMPRAGEAIGFVRLPTEAEWEYATRGGARIDATKFPGLTFFGAGDLRAYARFQAAGSSRGKLGPIGLRKPNPLGLFDVYGNAEELMLEPFRLNAIGRAGGQVGGIVTRGGSVLSTADQIYSAQRTEYPPYDWATGGPLQGATFGLRLVLASHIATSDDRLRQIRDRWVEMAGSGGEKAEPTVDPVAEITRLIEAEVDPRRKAALDDLKLEFRRSRDRTQTALQQSARSTLLAGAVFVDSLDENAGDIENKAGNIRLLIDLQRAGNNSRVYGRQVEKHVAEIKQMRQVQSTYLLSLRAALETLTTDIGASERQAAYDVLREELSLSGRTQTLQTLERFWADLAVYAARPDISPADLLKSALD
ncbi:formylglycine-generating enzyme family protein [Sedimentitalea nanhaiensis]|uniref:Sulfatase-modifying factor enzyme 1 n=1 Tax=Sedimentitalea nanhaiensis TaxID=999627 RepID=A0A1I6ZWQ9_9RHOB|nr:SUMF1/EgtB/PvdO family nonheme iron enzyme [Sedimentitalea nanhaiensis]SFT67150.1 Sulfatase-modifying factor enzyme 1 [Sedimentitalea nanhaiensis]